MLSDLFPEYLQPASEELDDLWNNGLLVLDTNVLLNLYRYTQGTRDELINTLRTFHDRLWVPHQVAKEFSRNRVSVLIEQRHIYEQFQKVLTDVPATIQKELERAINSRSHPIIDLTEIMDELRSTISRYSKELEGRLNLVPDDFTNDSVFDTVCDLLNGRIGSSWNSEELPQIETEGRRRFEQKTPPGYCDSDKDLELERQGDWFVWRQLLDKAKSEQAGAIFVTNDQKVDWWWRVRGRTLGPHPKLVEEFRTSTSKRVWFYTTERFLEYAKKWNVAQIDQETIQEIQSVSRSPLLAFSTWSGHLDRHHGLADSARQVALNDLTQELLGRGRDWDGSVEGYLRVLEQAQSAAYLRWVDSQSPNDLAKLLVLSEMIANASGSTDKHGPDA